jgi:hypothetical protein
MNRYRGTVLLYHYAFATTLTVNPVILAICLIDIPSISFIFLNISSRFPLSSCCISANVTSISRCIFSLASLSCSPHDIISYLFRIQKNRPYVSVFFCPCPCLTKRITITMTQLNSNYLTHRIAFCLYFDDSMVFYLLVVICCLKRIPEMTLKHLK